MLLEQIYPKRRGRTSIRVRYGSVFGNADGPCQHQSLLQREVGTRLVDRPPARIRLRKHVVPDMSERIKNKPLARPTVTVDEQEEPTSITGSLQIVTVWQETSRFSLERKPFS